jgi:hypothetical protein
MFKAIFSKKQTLWDKWEGRETPSTQITDLGTSSSLVEKEGLRFFFDDKPFDVLVEKITPTEVILTTDSLIVKGVSQGSILQPHPVQVPMKIGETRSFLTPTLNAGGKWDVTLEEITEREAEASQPDYVPLSSPSATPEHSHQPHTDTAAPNKPKALKFPKPYFKEVQELLKEIEKKVQSKVIFYYVPAHESIKSDDPDYFLEQLQHIGHQEKITLIIYSAGGDGLASLRIGTLLRKFCNTLDVIVPSLCASAATILALAADSINMSPIGFLTAIDSQYKHPLGPANKKEQTTPISHISIQNIISSLETEKPIQQDNETEGTYRTLFKYVHPVVVGDMIRSSKQSELLAEKMMKMHMSSFESEEKIVEIAAKLVNGYPQHGFTILYDEAKELGLPVTLLEDDLTYILWDLLKYYKALTKTLITNVAKGYTYHFSIPIVIESVDKRVMFKRSFYRRYSVETRAWQIENDNSFWTRLTPSDDPKKPFELTPIEFENSKRTDTHELGEAPVLSPQPEKA